MWLVDAIFEYAELRAEYFTPAIEDMINDTFLGFSVIILGLGLQPSLVRIPIGFFISRHSKIQILELDHTAGKFFF